MSRIIQYFIISIMILAFYSSLINNATFFGMLFIGLYIETRAFFIGLEILILLFLILPLNLISLFFSWMLLSFFDKFVKIRLVLGLIGSPIVILYSYAGLRYFLIISNYTPRFFNPIHHFITSDYVLLNIAVLFIFFIIVNIIFFIKIKGSIRKAKNIGLFKKLNYSHITEKQ